MPTEIKKTFHRYLNALLLILIRMDPELFPGSESGIIVPDPAKLEEQKNKILIYNFRPVNSGLCVL